MIAYRTVDLLGRIYEVSNLFDRHAQPTTDPVFAETCVIKLDDDHWVPTDTDGVPIYPVH